MPIERVQTDKAPKAIGPYSQGIRAVSFLFVSGQIPLDPATGNLVMGDIAAQTERVMKNIQAIVEAAGATMREVAKTTVFLADLGDFQAMNEVYGRFFGETPPARATVQVGRLPRDVRIEIDAVALLAR
ncbi:MAG: RidA family protein [Planctomycetes bacterium]|nr:RidA family protein [Planctomycetota bacterium]MBI3846819.1 RidA family protein [Planctomycetota bacterium]